MEDNVNILIDKSKFISKWKKEMKKTIKRMHPEWDDEIIENKLNEMLLSMQNPKVTLDNNYTGESRDTTLLSVLDWTFDRKPIIAGNATFYKNQIEAINPIASMLDGFLKERKRLKKEMFKVEDKTSDKYKDLDRAQLNQKILANSYYGASGMPSSAFFSKWSGPATTGSAQSVISTTETFFEGFLVDNYKFIDDNEVFHFMNLVLKQDYEIEDWVIRVSHEELIERLCKSFYDEDHTPEWDRLVALYVNNLSIDDTTKIFYKNNFTEFTRRHKKMMKYHDKIFRSVKNLEYAKKVDDIPSEYIDNFTGSDNDKVKAYNSFVNNQFFMDPNNPPDTVIDTLKEMKEIYMKYVYIPFMSIDRIHRLKYFPRKTVCIVDTDSNIMALDLWVKFCEEEVLQGNYGRSRDNNRFIIINTMAYFITATVSDTLNEYGIYSNIPDEYRSRYSMKNEFYFSKLIIGRKKKRYISAVKLREGNLLEPYKADVKGFEFMKSSTSEDAKKRFDKIVKTKILESELPDISGILHDLKDFEDDIRHSIEIGEKTYLPLGNAKNIEAYKDPYSQQGVRGALAWNLIYPDRAISFPSKVSILKLNIFSIEDIDDLRNTNPREYNIIKHDIFESKNKALSEKGLQVLSIPGNENIPEWCQPYIDKNTVINNIVGQFKGVLDVFGITCPEVGKQIKSVNRKTKKFSNVVRF